MLFVSCDRFWSDADIAATKASGNRIVASIESYKARNGVYPKDLGDLVESGFITAVPEPAGGKRKWEYAAYEKDGTYSLTAWDRTGKVPHSLEWTADSKGWVLDME